LQSDFNRLGADGFSFLMLEEEPGTCYNRRNIDKREARWIDRFLEDGIKLYNRDLKKTLRVWIKELRLAGKKI